MILDSEEQRRLLLEVINSCPIQGSFRQLEKLADSPMGQLKKAVCEAEVKKENDTNTNI